MYNFYGDQFEIIVLEIQQKYAINENLENCYHKIYNLINAEIENKSKDYDAEYARAHVEKLIQ